MNKNQKISLVVGVGLMIMVFLIIGMEVKQWAPSSGGGYSYSFEIHSGGMTILLGWWFLIALSATVAYFIFKK